MFHICVCVWISVIKMHLVSYSCLEKDKFTLPKKLMFKQNKGHLRGFPHPKSLQVVPLSEFYFLASKAWELVVKSREKSLNTPFKLGHLQFFKRPKSLWSSNCPPKLCGNPIQLVIFKTLTRYDWSKGNWSLSLVTRTSQGQTGTGEKMC